MESGDDSMFQAGPKRGGIFSALLPARAPTIGVVTDRVWLSSSGWTWTLHLESRGRQGIHRTIWRLLAFFQAFGADSSSCSPYLTYSTKVVWPSLFWVPQNATRLHPIHPPLTRLPLMH